MAEALKAIDFIRHICIHTTSFFYITKFRNNNKDKVRFQITALVAILSKMAAGARPSGIFVYYYVICLNHVTITRSMLG
jgi:hypothetical protein